MASLPSKLKVSRANDAVVLHLEGRATMQESPAFCEYAASFLSSSSVTLYADLRACTYLDSTFQGCLVQLHKRFNDPDDGNRFLLAAPADKCEKLFATARLSELFPRVDAPPSVVDEETHELAIGTMPSSELGRHVMECHRELAELAGPHQALYRSIADELARELGK